MSHDKSVCVLRNAVLTVSGIGSTRVPCTPTPQIRVWDWSSRCAMCYCGVDWMFEMCMERSVLLSQKLLVSICLGTFNGWSKFWNLSDLLEYSYNCTYLILHWKLESISIVHATRQRTSAYQWKGHFWRTLDKPLLRSRPVQQRKYLILDSKLTNTA